MRALGTIALLVLGSLAISASARAQLPSPPDAPSAEDVAEGREAFIRGMEFARERRFAAARREFVHSYALSGSPVALFNLASTLRSLEEHVTATQAFARLLATPQLDPRIRSQAEPMYREVAGHVGRLILHGALDGATLRVDAGPARPLSGDREAVAVAPGRHELRADRAGAEPWTWRGDVEAGAALDLLVELRAADAQPPANDGSTDDAADPLPLALGLTGGALAVIAAIVIGVVVADSESQLGPRTTLVLELP